MLLSIIIPIYNVENYLEKCLTSIVQDSAVDSEQIELMLIDDGSTDSSGTTADGFAQKYPFINVIHKKNSGVAAARNIGIETALGEWLYFVDSDDWLAENAISNICRQINSHPNADMLLFDAYKNNANREVPWEHFDSEKIISEQSDIRALQREVLYFHKTPLAAPWDKVFSHLFLTENKIKFQENLKVLDDMIFNVEVFGAAKEIAYCKDKIYHYRYVTSSITNSYKPDRVEQDLKVWNYLEQYMGTTFFNDGWNEADKDAFRQAYFCRVIKSFGICCRLCFFNKENPKGIKAKVDYLKETLLRLPYKDAFADVTLHNVEWKLKVMVIMARFHLGYGIYLLHLLESFARKSFAKS